MIFFSKELKIEDFGTSLLACRDAFIGNYNLTKKQADKLISTSWTFVTGLATLVHTGAIHLTEEQVSNNLSEQFVGALSFIQSGRDVSGVTPKKRDSADKITLAI